MHSDFSEPSPWYLPERCFTDFIISKQQNNIFGYPNNHKALQNPYVYVLSAWGQKNSSALFFSGFFLGFIDS